MNTQVFKFIKNDECDQIIHDYFKAYDKMYTEDWTINISVTPMGSEIGFLSNFSLGKYMQIETNCYDLLSSLIKSATLNNYVE